MEYVSGKVPKSSPLSIILTNLLKQTHMPWIIIALPKPNKPKNREKKQNYKW